MKRLYIAIITFFILLLLAVAVYFLGSLLPNTVDQSGTNQQNLTIQEIIPEPEQLTKEEQKEVLDELLPEELVETQEEIDEQVNLLNQLQNEAPQNDALDLLNQLGGNTSTEEQLRQLEALQN